ncbi:MAG: glycosyltransferase [Plesiomonas sp.]
MKYLIINPYYNASHGIANYIQSLKRCLTGIEIITFENKKNLSPELFREEVYDYITTKFGTHDIIIEAPEAKAATLLIPSSYKVHIRLHCPLAVAQKYDNKKQNQMEFSNELRVIYKAKYVSSPSYGLYQEIKNELTKKPDFFYKNPIDPRITTNKENNIQKEYDLVFMGRFQELKGINHLNKILSKLPKEYKVLLFGPNSNLFKTSKNILCDITKKGLITGDEKLNLIRKSKCLMLPSEFENCSMVILEALASHTPVVCWNVGGNSEIAPPNIVSCAKYDNHHEFAQKIVDFIETPPEQIEFEKIIKDINTDFELGINSIIKSAKLGITHSYLGLNNRHYHHYTKIKNNSAIISPKLRIFGIAFSNEHIEELWAPVIDHLEYEYRYVCRRPLGYHSVFKHEKYPIKQEFVCIFDWIKDSDRLIKQLKSYRPNLILFHNGSHPIYRETINKIKALRIPILYSELGWFPQKDHVYFDQWGVNGKSYIASLSAEELCNQNFNEELNEIKPINGEYALIITQLENDTNLIVNSPKFKNNENFIEHIIDEIGNKTKIIIKPHPLEKNTSRYSRFISKNVKLVINEDSSSLIKSAHSVIGINSTVLIQALCEDVNIYTYGSSILDNKKVTIDCQSKSISKQWSNVLIGSRKKRNSIIKELKSRQINLLEIRNGITKSNINLLPLIENYTLDFSNIITKSTKQDGIKKENTNNTNKNLNLNHKRRLMNKFIKSPPLFIKDLIKKRIKNLSRENK